MTIPRLLDIPIRVVISFALLYCIYLVSTRAIAHWYFRQAPPEGLLKAIQWDPGNPMYYAALARVRSDSLAEADLSEVVRLYEKAAELSPNDARYWAELGGVYEQAGRLTDAHQAYERAQRLFPNSPNINWQLGNFYLRQGNIPGALKALQMVVVGDPSLRQPAFDLAWRAGAGPDLILEEMIPAHQQILFHYLDYLTARHKLDEAGQVWERTRSLRIRFEPSAAFSYLDALVAEKRVDELTKVWAELVETNPFLARRSRFESNLLNNGDFESDIINGGLDWRVSPLEGVVVSVDNLIFFDGTRSLKVVFDGQHNTDYGHVYQFVPVKPNTAYRFICYMRTQEITTDSGPRFQLYDYFDPSKLHLATENLVETSSWSPQLLEFQTGPETRLLMIRLARPPSRRIDNKLAGTIWLDRARLTVVE